MMTALDFQKKKQSGTKITMVTCSDSTSGALLNRTSVDALLVGDSLAMTMHGFSTTLSATLEMMVLHTAAVARAARDKFIISDLPFLSYRGSLDENIRAVQALAQAGAHAIKLEGAAGNVDFIRHTVESGVPVMGHIGLTPQFVHQLGGYRVQGRTGDEARRLRAEAAALEVAGCFALVLECAPAPLAAEIAQDVRIPVIGIGAGGAVDGQVLVLQDLLGMNPDFKPRFVRNFLDGAALVTAAVEDYAQAVRACAFPGPAHSFGVDRADTNGEKKHAALS